MHTLFQQNYNDLESLLKIDTLLDKYLDQIKKGGLTFSDRHFIELALHKKQLIDINFLKLSYQFLRSKYDFIYGLNFAIQPEKIFDFPKPEKIYIFDDLTRSLLPSDDIFFFLHPYLITTDLNIIYHQYRLFHQWYQKNDDIMLNMHQALYAHLTIGCFKHQTTHPFYKKIIAYGTVKDGNFLLENDNVIIEQELFLQ